MCIRDRATAGRPEDARVGEHDVQAQLRRVLGQGAQMVGGSITLGLTAMELEIEGEQPAGLGAHERLPQIRHEHVRQHRGKPGPGPEHHPIGIADGIL